ncbi:hypothetical protein [Candidatus Solirubrobacter pratensis]|jgi:hypothetical protein|uniref:hypothetical protein n=1 Tax=Candidatus Solirubrobacter pratensis TaxID=1298857 RepID=UPI0004123635|nr:hypothetical protein [Candidatus Solirubrobacter pratensis]
MPDAIKRVVDLAAIVRKGGTVQQAQFSEGILTVSPTTSTTDLTPLAPHAGGTCLAKPRR